MSLITKTSNLLSFGEFRMAIYSACESYRYQLGIWFQPDTLEKTAQGGIPKGRLIQFIGLNPSTATEMCDDNTVRRCKNWAKAWGYDGMIMTNAFAYRATDPKHMKAHHEPVGPNNDEQLRIAHESSVEHVACWGNDGTLRDRSQALREMFRGTLKSFGLTKAGEPLHPLYLPNKIELINYH
ncbi:MAG TPA: DUF1643 domain-containing protein [Methylomirabilota bacterium]|nr:DUF1643 domain-containing protein [Methylomirabilota bacterium]